MHVTTPQWVFRKLWNTNLLQVPISLLSHGYSTKMYIKSAFSVPDICCRQCIQVKMQCLTTWTIYMVWVAFNLRCISWYDFSEWAILFRAITTVRWWELSQKVVLMMNTWCLSTCRPVSKLLGSHRFHTFRPNFTHLLNRWMQHHLMIRDTVISFCVYFSMMYLAQNKASTKGLLYNRSWGPFHYHGLTFIPAWISDHAPNKFRDEIISLSQTSIAA